MPAEFKTFGPFEVRRTSGVVTKEDLDVMWLEIKKKHSGLEAAIGVYIFAKQIGDTPSKPWYVGRTDGGFQKRFEQHLYGKKTFVKLAKLAPNGKLQVFLLARIVGQKNGYKRPSKKKMKSIRMLEFLLIGLCLTRNKKLHNTSEKSFHRGLYVPGYLNNKPGKPDSSAKSLASMLNIV